MLKELVLATRNRHKGEELAALLADLGICIRTLDDFPGVHEVEENGVTCEANAVMTTASAPMAAAPTGYALPQSG